MTLKNFAFAVVIACGGLWLAGQALDAYAYANRPMQWSLYVTGPRTYWVKTLLDIPPSEKICYEEAVAFNKNDGHMYQCVYEDRYSY